MVWVLPVLSGVLFALASPGYDLFPLSYLFFLPLLTAFSRDLRHPALAFALFELTRNIMLLTFIPKVMVHYGGMHPALGYTGWIGLSVFLALLCAPFGLLIKKTLNSDKGWLLIPLIFAGKDAFLEIVFGGFPWCLLGYTQLKSPYLLQWAEIGGVHLLTALVILINLLIFRFITIPGKRRAVGLISVLVILLMGGFLLRRHTEGIAEGSGEAVPIAVLQPNSSYDNFTGYEPRLTELLDQSSQLVQSGARAVVWPEYSLPLYPRQRPEFGERFQQFARDNAPLIGGFTDRRSREEIYNAVFLFDGRSMQQYNKMHLAPFGEYIPFRPLFFFISRITDEISDFNRGKSLKPLTLLNHPIGLPICYEAIFPGLVSRFVAEGAELLIVTSNDSWYSGGKAHQQLLAMSAMRAVENRRYQLRSTANGYSAWVTPLGEIRDRIPYDTEGSFIAPIRFIKSRTLFSLGGVHFGTVCLILSGLMLLWLIRRRFAR